MQKVYTLQELANLLGTPRTTLDHHVRQGWLPSTLISKRLRVVEPEHLTAYEKNLKQALEDSTNSAGKKPIIALEKLQNFLKNPVK